MMQIRNTKQRRGDKIVHINSRTTGVFVTTMIGLILIAFAIGVGTGWALFGRSVMEVEIRPDETSLLAASPDASRLASTDASAAETASAARVATPSTSSEQAATRPAPMSTPVAARPAPMPPPTDAQPATAPPATKRFAIVAGSIRIGDTPVIARAEADKLLATLKVKGYRSARIEEVTIANKGTFFRVIAMEANYHTAAAARRDVEAMIRRGDLTRGFALFLGETQ